MTLYRGGGLSRVFCTSRTLPSCSCLAIAAQETAVRYPMVDDSNRFFKSKAVCAVRYANFAGELLQKRRFRPIFARRAGAADGNDLWQRERPTGSNPGDSH